jgi:hypothetical protein
MSLVLFVGPTLSRDAIDLDAQVRGPVRCGDVVVAVREGFQTLAIIDGYFDQCLPVWHKEILWALAQGRAVYGAASMGALRAAELCAFGMQGIGRIFEAYRDGLLEDDDEVALAHADASEGYRALSEPLVNIRVTLSRAVADGVLQRPLADQYLELARRRFYPQRSFHQLLLDAQAVALLRDTVDALRGWLGPRFERRVDQKAEDARTLIERLSAGPGQGAAQPRLPLVFAHTEGFQELLRRHPGQRH